MKVLHLATYDAFGGASRAAFRQHCALLEAGIDSKMLVRHSTTGMPSVIAYQPARSLASRAVRELRRRWISFCEQRSRTGGKGRLTDPRADLLRGSCPLIEEADVVNIHKTEHFADIPALFHALPREKPIVVTLHDLSPLTGGCDYPGACEGFKERCGSCPVLDSSNESDYSRSIFQLRRDAYMARGQRKLIFAANSRWTKKIAEQSGLTRGFEISLQHLGIDQKVYHAKERRLAREALGLSKSEKTVCFAAHNVGHERKGGRQLLEALEIVSKELPITVLTMGEGLLASVGVWRHLHFGKVESDQLQSLIYRAADVFVIPSLEEAFGQTALEAAACGTLVAGFRAGGIADIVEEGLNGRLVTTGDGLALGEAIGSLLVDHDLQSRWAYRAESWTADRFSYAKNASSYLQLYERIIAG